MTQQWIGKFAIESKGKQFKEESFFLPSSFILSPISLLKIGCIKCLLFICVIITLISPSFPKFSCVHLLVLFQIQDLFSLVLDTYIDDINIYITNIYICVYIMCVNYICNIHLGVTQSSGYSSHFKWSSKKIPHWYAQLFEFYLISNIVQLTTMIIHHSNFGHLCARRFFLT